MHTLLLVMVTSGLVLLLTTQGLTTNLEPDADLLEEVIADGFIVSTKGPTKTEKPQDNFNAIIIHDSTNPEANLSLFQKDSLPTVTTVKTPEASTEPTTENSNELPKNESATVLITVGPSQTTTLSPVENDEGSGIFSEPDIEMHTSMTHTTIETAAEVDISIDGSGMVLNEKPEEDLPFTTTVHTLVFRSSEENAVSGMGRKPPTSDWLTTMSTIIEEEAEIAVRTHIEVAVEKPTDESGPDPVETVSFEPEVQDTKSGHDPKPTVSAFVKEGTPGWLLILALCLTLGAVICVFAGIATKDMWYGPSRQCLNINSTESKKDEEYDKAATLPLSEKEMVALMSSQKEERKETDCTIISLEEVPEKEYLM
ncbi:hypothetical protein PGIGA_G00154000 [Pangasianodon gigas]|uniref:Uncharacterized protein n=1 Tax=Pangasianodon gigas TaxID=30993 RepID=A0ACC5XPD7_PANGG|nr:hypothetical protein [Pangasianodon gigas]